MKIHYFQISFSDTCNIIQSYIQTNQIKKRCGTRFLNSLHTQLMMNNSQFLRNCQYYYLIENLQFLIEINFLLNNNIIKQNKIIMSQIDFYFTISSKNNFKEFVFHNILLRILRFFYEYLLTVQNLSDRKTYITDEHPSFD